MFLFARMHGYRIARIGHPAFVCCLRMECGFFVERMFAVLEFVYVEIAISYDDDDG